MILGCIADDFTGATDPGFLSGKGEAVKKLSSIELGPYGVVRIRTA